MIRFTLLFLVLAANAWANIDRGDEAIEIERIEGSTIFFKSVDRQVPVGTPLQTGLHDLEYYGSVTPVGQDFRYLVLGGRECLDCLAYKKVYLFRDDGQGKAYAFSFPGKVRDYRNGRVIYDGRAFFGDCLYGKKDVYVAYQKEKIRRWKYLQHSVFVADLRSNPIQEQVITRRRPSLNGILSRVRQKRCVEIRGQNRTSAKYRSLIRRRQNEMRERQKSVPNNG